jgi:hypothetical protein
VEHSINKRTQAAKNGKPKREAATKQQKGGGGKEQRDGAPKKKKKKNNEKVKGTERKGKRSKVRTESYLVDPASSHMLV